MKTPTTAIMCLLSVLFPLVLTTGSCTQETKDSATIAQNRELFESKCQQCHSLDRIKQAHLDKDMTREVVERMRKKEGANISKDEANVIYNVLDDYFTVAPSPPVVPAPIR
jgi:hypothetical protein